MAYRTKIENYFVPLATTKLESGKIKARCPFCGRTVQATVTSTYLDTHISRGKNCIGSKQLFTFKIGEWSQPKSKKKSVSSNATEGSQRRQRKRRQKPRRHRGERRRNGELSNRDYDYLTMRAEDSWGDEYLGWEGGERSVRARRGGAFESNRSRH